MTKLESAQGIKTDTQKPLANIDGWKSLANWRQLTTGMTPIDVRGLLGEPQRVDGGDLAYWHYPNRGFISFFQGKLNGWREPK